MQTSLLMQLLQMMENPLVVVACVLVMLVVRVLWKRSLTPAEAPAANARVDARAATPPPSEPAKPPKKDTVLEIIDTIIIALILVFGIVRPFFLQTFFIPSESMVPTLKVDDKLIANKFIYLLRPPQPGEVVVFSPPTQALEGSNIDFVLRRWAVEHPHSLSAAEWASVVQALKNWPASNMNMPPAMLDQLQQMAEQHPEQIESWIINVMPRVEDRHDDYIKRVIGVAGDHVSFSGGQVYINGQLRNEPYLHGKYKYVTDFPGIPTTPPEPFQPMSALGDQMMAPSDFGGYFLNWLNKWYLYNYCYLPNVRNETLQNIPGHLEYIVPHGSVMVMGDNRLDSFDSRYWGMEPIKNVKARAIATFWPIIGGRVKLL